MKTFSSPASPLADKALGLKLDLGPAMSDDDCEEDYADLMDAAAASGNRARAADAAKPAAGQAQAAKPAAPATAAPVAPPPPPPAPAWEVTPADKTLNTVLARWAAAAGWQLVWELPVDYAVGLRTEVRGTFAEAVGMVTKSMATAEIPMKAIFYEGNRVLRIVPKGSE
ncbi:toxin co-regulated pilus biosynthesis Q family protein [Pseudoduganella namucuonensis]|uniref:toxin co-regulated pilus biosynthesis Q family protein n=1 Tax=Pseudoduganella namucuonensis TaxID=1035707 RepID=UPI001E642C8E|nr:toxin co-regulated pilus biosynthesis Q family protein [Pseudoduganella namucuonensis]